MDWIKSAAIIALGADFGANLRYFVSDRLARHQTVSFPLGEQLSPGHPGGQDVALGGGLRSLPRRTNGHFARLAARRFERRSQTTARAQKRSFCQPGCVPFSGDKHHSPLFPSGGHMIPQRAQTYSARSAVLLPTTAKSRSLGKSPIAELESRTAGLASRTSYPFSCIPNP